MQSSDHRRRAQWAAGIAVLAGIVAVITLAVPDWIEAVFGVDPDAGDGALEWAIPVVLGLIALAAVLSGVRHLRLSQA